MIAKCEICGKEFDYDTKLHKKYCSKECQKVSIREGGKRFRAKQKEKKIRKEMNTVQNFCNAAREKGLDYAEAQKLETLELITPERWRRGNVKE